jgi:hypothetical protein
MRIQSLASPSPHGYSRTISSHHRIISYSRWNKRVALALAVSILACIPARTASFPFRSVSAHRRHAQLDSIHPGSTSIASITSIFKTKPFFVVHSPSRSLARTTSTLYSNNNDNQDDTPFLVGLIDTLVDFSKRPFALNSDNGGKSKGNAVSALYPATLLLVAVTQPLSSFLTTLSLFVALVTATRQLVFASDDDDDDEPYASGSGRNGDSGDTDDDDDDDDRGLQVFLTDGFSLAASFASARLLLPPNLAASSGLAPLSVPPGVVIGVLAAAGVAVWQSTSRRGRLESATEDDDDNDNDPEQRLLDLWDQRFKRRERKDGER